MAAPALRPLRVGEVLDTAITLVRNNLETLVKLVAAFVVPIQALSALLGFVFLSETSDPEEMFVVDETTGTAEIDGSFWGFIGGSFLLMILTVVGTLIVTGAATRAIGQAYVSDPPEWRDAIRGAMGRFWSMFGLALMLMVLGFIGLMLCLVPGIYVFAVGTIALPALILEGKSPGAAFSRARDLVSGRVLTILGTLLIAYVLQMVVGAVISGVFGAITIVSGDVGDLIANFLGGVASQLITTPFVAGVAVVLYVDLRVRKEGFDLQLLAQDVGVPAPSGLGDTPAPPPPSGPIPPEGRPGMGRGSGNDDIVWPPRSE